MPEFASAAEWIVLAVVLAAAIGADLGVSRFRSGKNSLRSAFVEIVAWIGLSVLFGFWICFSRGWKPGFDFFSAYLIEKSLSVDNIFLFLVIFRSFDIPSRPQHKVLYSGIAGAIVLRGIFIFGGLALLARFHAVVYVFGGLLLLTGLYMLAFRRKSEATGGGWVIRLVRKYFPAAPPDCDHFFVRSIGKWRATSLLLALVAVELADVAFAIDSVPAVLAITRDPFVAYSSNIFAILGLRAMYLGLAALLPRFRYLHQGLAAILLFVGGKMILGERYPLPEWTSLSVVAAILLVAATASWIGNRAKGES